MKAVALLSLFLLVVAVQARPAEPEVASEVARAPQGQLPHKQRLPEISEAVVRERRSPKEREDGDRGSVTGGVHREDGVGTVVHAQGEGTVWKSKDGNARVDAHGDWSKVVDGPGRGKPNYNVGIKFTGRF